MTEHKETELAKAVDLSVGAILMIARIQNEYYKTTRFGEDKWARFY